MTLEGKALLAAAASIGLVFGLPLAFAPIRWARVFGWWIPEDARLATYFGRCLGALILVLAAFAVYAAFHPALQPAALGIATGGAAAMVVTHAIGAIEKAQPLSETVEGVAWLAAAIGLGWLWLG